MGKKPWKMCYITGKWESESKTDSCINGQIRVNNLSSKGRYDISGENRVVSGTNDAG